MAQVVAARRNKTYERAGLSADEISLMLEAFNLFDQDQDGYIQGQEFLAVLQTLGVDTKTESAVKAIAEVERREKGVNFDYVLDKMLEKFVDVTTDDELHKIFNIFDEEGLGRISLKNLRSLCQSLGDPLTEADLVEMIDRADIDDDGEINFTEFSTIMNRIQASKDK